MSKSALILFILLTGWLFYIGYTLESETKATQINTTLRL